MINPKIKAILIASFLLLVNAGTFADNSLPTLPENPLIAARTFESKQCIHCHHIDFKHKGFGPDLARTTIGDNVYDIMGLMWNSAPEMVQKMDIIDIDYPQLTPLELINLLAFIGIYQNYVVNYSREVDVKNGERLFEAKKCVSCHTFNPDANTTGPSLKRFRGAGSPLTILRAMWLHSYYMKKAGARMGIEWPKFDKGEIRDLLAFIIGDDQDNVTTRRYFRPGSPQSGQKLFHVYECDKCHSVKGTGAKKAPDLGYLLIDRGIDIYIILEAFWNHSPTMWETFKKAGKRVPRITTGELADIIAYLFMMNFDQSTGNAEEGQVLFETKTCVKCHEPTFASNDKVQLLAGLWNSIPEMLVEAKQKGIEWPIFSSGEISSIVEFLILQSE